MDYTLYLSTAKSSDEILVSLEALSNADDLISCDEPDLSFLAADVDHPVTRADIEETYGFVPSVKIMFMLDKFHDNLPELQAKLVRSVIALLVEEEGDAVLEFVGGPPVLKRNGGQLLLNENWSLWKSKALEGLALDYRFAAL